MKWDKIGLIIKPDRQLWWMRTHAMLPTSEHLEGSIFRVYFSGRNDKNQSHTGFADVDFEDDYRVLRFSEQPILCPGELGCFDDCGVTPSCIVNTKGKKYLYYIGWKTRSSVRFGLLPGLAVSEDGGESFQRVSRAPVLHRSDREPFGIMTAPCVILDANLWRMWYVSCEGWIHADLPTYNIKYAESKDGLSWNQTGIVCVDFKSEKETALARPCVIKEEGLFKMWFSYKTENTAYRMGYAESKDGIKWQRNDEIVGIDVSETGWDSEMIEYANIVSYKNEKYIFYNGDGYGVGGAGIAKMTG